LVVDDSITVRNWSASSWRGGLRCRRRGGRVDGWKRRAGRYHLVISDVDMPRMDGIQLVRSLKSDAPSQRHPRHHRSYKDREKTGSRLDAGADGYLTKSSFHDRTFLDAVWT
jgi:two-component system sensor histidine kinase and response regulator WspE